MNHFYFKKKGLFPNTIPQHSPQCVNRKQADASLFLFLHLLWIPQLPAYLMICPSPQIQQMSPVQLQVTLARKAVGLPKDVLPSLPTDPIFCLLPSRTNHQLWTFFCIVHVGPTNHNFLTSLPKLNLSPIPVGNLCEHTSQVYVYDS